MMSAITTFSRVEQDTPLDIWILILGIRVYGDLIPVGSENNSRLAGGWIEPSSA